MLSRSLAALALAAAVVACGDDDTGDVARPDQLRLTIVSGDGQTAPVRPAGSAAASAGLAPAAALPPNLLPEPLVAQIVVSGASPSASPLGPSLATLPSDLVVTFRVVQPQDQLGRDCGESFIDAARPDTARLVTTYWERGTIAGIKCRLEVRLVVDGVPRVDTVFTAEFQPGELAAWSMISSRPVEGHPGDTIHLADFFTGWRDGYGNPIPVDSVIAHEPAGWAWRPYECTSTSCTVANLPEAADSIGWGAVVPAEILNWPNPYPGASRNAELCIWLHDTSTAKNRTCFGMHVF